MKDIRRKYTKYENGKILGENKTTEMNGPSGNKQSYMFKVSLDIKENNLLNFFFFSILLTKLHNSNPFSILKYTNHCIVTYTNVTMFTDKNLKS